MEATFDGPTKLTIRGRATLAVFLVSILTLCIILTGISSSTTEPNTVVTAAINVSNTTLCSYLKHFSLSRNIVISVCLLNKHIRIDIRHFVNDKPTIRGIYLDDGLLKLLPKIISNIHEIKDRNVTL